MLNPFQSLNHERLEQVLAGLFPQKVELREGKDGIIRFRWNNGPTFLGERRELRERGMKKSV